MEVFQTEKFYIFVRADRSLWWNRYTSEFTSNAGWDLSSVDDIECIGITSGIVGVISLPGVYEPHLVIVKEATPVGVIYPPHLVYRIKSICILGDDVPDVPLTACPRHSSKRPLTTATSASSGGTTSSATNQAVAKAQLVNKSIWGAVKSAGTTLKNTTQQAAALATNQIRSSTTARDPTKIEKRITDELHKIFDDSDSFYFCPDADITHNLQRRGPGAQDERFFWNRHMLKGVLALKEEAWVLPVIQGFIQVENCVIDDECFTLALVSRRSRHRAGTRYKRRGVDDNGHCANYVETEQILSFRHHQMSFTQVRGSVPVHWSQPGYKYRPPPRLDKDPDDTHLAFEKHFTDELRIYRSVYVVNLVEQAGKEKVIFDAYGDHIVRLDSKNLIYVTFDFHDYCRGMRFENVSALIEAVAPEAGAMGFNWHDSKGAICEQKSVFRVNCMDCLDRTNVVQTAFGKAVLESQLVKLGLAPPYSPIPEQLKQPFMMLWANNGDIISRQYAGTNALKGDYTRTGERKFTGLMKDGMNSANRYVIQHFDDNFRQCAIDLMLGHLRDGSQLYQDQPFDTVLAVCRAFVEPLLPTVPKPNRQVYSLSVFRNELWLTEQLVHFTSNLQQRVTNALSSLPSVSYYLARFKDTYRQATIDMMLGNHVSSESVSALGGQSMVLYETDALDSAEHARLLVEDCRRMLLGGAQHPIGAWGLIDADPSNGDPNETEVDTILLLTDELYLVAEYDSHLDKIVRFERVPLNNVTLVEFGQSCGQSKLFQSAVAQRPCIRINYTVDAEDGYFHMFRSANIRFFNNVAVVTKTHDEIMESLMAIVECFRITLDNCGRGSVPFVTSGTLQRRKSRTPMLDVPRDMPRNLSESQLVQIGSKAISNVAGQFSKLGQSLNPAKIRAAKIPHSNLPQSPSSTSLETAAIADEESMAHFTIGSGHLTINSQRDYGDEYDSDDGSVDIQATSDAVDANASTTHENAFLPSVGIVMASNEVAANAQHQDQQHTMVVGNAAKRCSADVCTISLSSVMDNINMPAGMLESGSPTIRSRSPAPEIRVDDVLAEGSGSSGLGKSGAQAFSRSSGEMRSDGSGALDGGNSSLSRDMSLNLTSSQSENALKQLKTLTSPLSKFATGMKSFGMNLDPRKMGAKSPLTEDAMTLPRNELVIQRLHEQWDVTNCKTKLIAL